MDDTVLYMVNVNVQLMRQAAQDMMMYKKTPIPIAYTHLLEVFVKIYVLTAPVALVPLLLWMAPPVVMLVTFFFYGFLSLGRMMFDPFKDEPDSFPTADWLDELLGSMHEMVELVPGGVPTRDRAETMTSAMPPSDLNVSDDDVDGATASNLSTPCQSPMLPQKTGAPFVSKLNLSDDHDSGDESNLSTPCQSPSPQQRRVIKSVSRMSISDDADDEMEVSANEEPDDAHGRSLLTPLQSPQVVKLQSPILRHRRGKD